MASVPQASKTEIIGLWDTLPSFFSRLPFVSSRELVNGDRCYICTRLFLCRIQNGLKRQLLHDSSLKKKNAAFDV